MSCPPHHVESEPPIEGTFLWAYLCCLEIFTALLRASVRILGAPNQAVQCHLAQEPLWEAVRGVEGVLQALSLQPPSPASLPHCFLGLPIPLASPSLPALKLLAGHEGKLSGADWHFLFFCTAQGLWATWERMTLLAQEFFPVRKTSLAWSSASFPHLLFLLPCSFGWWHGVKGPPKCSSKACVLGDHLDCLYRPIGSESFTFSDKV